MAKKKLSTAEILARARAEDSGQQQAPAAEEGTPTAEESAQSEPAAEKPTPSAGEAEPEGEEEKAAPPPKKPAGRPKSTKDILAAARARDAGGEKGRPGAAEKPEAEEKAKPAAKAPSGGAGQKKPGSIKDKLAAARAQDKGGAKPTAPEKPAAEKKEPPTKKTAPAKETAAKSSGERPSVQEMLKAVREAEKPGAGGGAGTAVAEPAAPPKRKKPAAARTRAGKGQKARQGESTRRGFLWALLVAPIALLTHPFAAAWALFATAVGAFSLALARFMMPNVLVEPPSKFKVGPPSNYPPGTVSTKWKSQYGIWLVHSEYEGSNLIYALISVCTHLGCTPNWLEGEQKFKCPCHGSGFYISGINFEGPAPRPLERAAIRLAPDGLLEVDKSQQFQQELGDWDDPASYVELV